MKFRHFHIKKKKKEGWLRFKHDNVICGNILKVFLCLVRGGKG